MNNEKDIDIRKFKISQPSEKWKEQIVVPQTETEYFLKGAFEKLGGALIAPRQLARQEIVSPLKKVLDLTQRFQYASANVAAQFNWRDMVEVTIEGMKQQKPLGEVYRDMTEALIGETKPKQIAYALWDGLSGKQKASYIDLLKREGVPDSWAILFGLSLDIGADPLTYIPIAGAIAGIRKGLASSKTVQKATKVLSNTQPFKWLGEAFVPGFKLPKEYYLLKRKFGYLLNTREREVLDEVANFTKKLKPSERKLLSWARQHPEKISLLSPKQQEILMDIGNKIDDLGKQAVDIGLISEKTFKKWKGTYLPGFYEDWSKIISGRIPPDMMSKLSKPSFVRMKKFKTLAEAQEFGRQLENFRNLNNLDDMLQYAASLGIEDQVSSVAKAAQTAGDDPVKAVKKFMLSRAKAYKGVGTDILKLYGVRKIEQTRFVIRQQFIDEVMTRFGTPVNAKDFIKGVPEGMGLYLPKGRLRFFPAKNTIQKSKIDRLIEKHGDDVVIDLLKDEDTYSTLVGITKNVKGYLLPKEIAQDLNKINTFFMLGDKQSAQLLRLFDKYHSLWKAYATGTRLPFHLRNFYSNIFLIWLGGIHPLQISRRMLQALKVQKGMKGTIKLGKKIWSIDDLRKLAPEEGVIGHGWMGAERLRVLDELESILKQGKWRYLNPAKAGREFGTAIEDNARLALFLDRLAKGDKPADAARMVRRYLFDYSELTDFERNVMRRIFPFYTWLRKNIPLEIEELVRQPGKYATVKKTMDAFERLAAETYEERFYKPEHMERLLYMKTPWKDDKGNPLYVYIDLPIMDIDTLTRLHEEFLSYMNPIITSGLGVLTGPKGIKTFPRAGMPVERFKGELVPAPFYLAWFPENVWWMFGLKQIRDKTTGRMVLGMPAKIRHLLDTVLPISPTLAELDRLIPQANVYIENERAPWRKVSYLTGIKIIPRNLQQEKLWWAISKRNKLGDLSRWIRQFVEPPSEEEILEKIRDMLRN